MNQALFSRGEVTELGLRQTLLPSWLVEGGGGM